MIEIMKSTGIIRRVDDLGRIVIPKEIRMTYGIEDGSPIEIFTDSDGIILRKYRAENELMNTVNVLSDTVEGYIDDLDCEKVQQIRKHIEEIRGLLKRRRNENE